MIILMWLGWGTHLIGTEKKQKPEAANRLPTTISLDEDLVKISLLLLPIHWRHLDLLNFQILPFHLFLSYARSSRVSSCIARTKYEQTADQL